MATKKPAYTITAADDTVVDARTERPAAIKRADALTEETGLVHRVYTPGGKPVHETEVIEPAPADDIPSVDISELIEEVIEEAETEAGPVTEEDVNAPVTEEDEGTEDVTEDVEVAEPVTETVEDTDEEETEPSTVEDEVAEVVAEEVAEDGGEDAAEDGEGELAEDEGESWALLPYATVMDRLNDSDAQVSAAATAEWERRLTIYRELTNHKDATKRIVGPAMAAALELGKTADGRTRAALKRRGLIQPGEGQDFTVNDAGQAALTAALTAIQ
jgi:hypothetical protein